MYDPTEELPDEPYNKKNTSISLGDGINKLLNSYQIKGKFTESVLKSKWTEIVGKTIAQRTTSIFLYEETLVIKISSPPLKHQLNSASSRLITRINEVMEKEVVSKIIVK